jgi:hypothetical protein
MPIRCIINYQSILKSPIALSSVKVLGTSKREIVSCTPNGYRRIQMHWPTCQGKTTTQYNFSNRIKSNFLLSVFFFVHSDTHFLSAFKPYYTVRTKTLINQTKTKEMELAGLSPHPSQPPHPWRRALSSRSFISPFSRSLPLLTHHTSTQPLSLHRRITLLSRSKTDSHEALDAEEIEYDDEQEEEEGEVATWSRKPVSLLSLNSKPNRNLSLLDEYEMEERDASHKSGLYPLSYLQFEFEILNYSSIEPTFDII